MTSNYQSQIGRLEKEISGLDRDTAAAARKEADLITKINRAHDAARRTNSVSSLQSKMREIDQASKSLADIKKKQADISTKRSQKYNNLLDYQKRQARADEAARTKIENEQRRLVRAGRAQQRRMSLEPRGQSLPSLAEASVSTFAETYDFFICHASEDKDEVVRELAERLRSRGANVWYDEFTLSVGSRLRREIERGLAHSRFGIVVVSESFFAKDWPQRELDGLFALDTKEQSRILPIWHKVTRDEVAQRSPILADLVALNMGVQSIDTIVEELLLKVQ